MSDKSDFMDENNGTINNLREFIRQDSASEGLNVTVADYEEERGNFGQTVTVVEVSTEVDGELHGFEIAVEDEDAPQNIYLAQAEHMLKGLRQDVLADVTSE